MRLSQLSLVLDGSKFATFSLLRFVTDVSVNYYDMHEFSESIFTSADIFHVSNMFDE